MKKINSCGFTHLIALLFIIISVAAIGTYMVASSHAAVKYQRIVDVSFPQCGRRITAVQGIIGVNGGRPRTHNKCLKTQAHRMDSFSLYVNSAYTSKHYMPKGAFCKHNTAACWAYNKGASDGRYDIVLANKINGSLYTGQWWIDVEKDSSGGNTGNAWTTNADVNVEYLKGMMSVLSYGDKSVGFYSNPNSWQTVTGGWQNNHPSWLALGVEPPNDQNVALQTCDRGFTGGSLYFVQYILNKDQPKAVDVDYACHPTASDSIRA